MGGIRHTDLDYHSSFISLLVILKWIIWNFVSSVLKDRSAVVMALINFFFRYGRLKRIPRTGWLLRGVSLGDVESVAEHTLRTAAISMILAHLLCSRGIKVDVLKVVEMAILHDLAEAMILDVNRDVSRRIGSERKEYMERIAEDILLEELPEDLKGMYRKTLDELHRGESLEARIVRTSDRLETIMQAVEYSYKYAAAVLEVFYQDINEVEDFSLDELKELIGQLGEKKSKR